MASPSLGPRRKVLFVEDESALRRTYQRFFADRYHLAFAASGTEARQQLAEFRPEVLVLDLRLPDTDGAVLLHRMRGQHGGRDIPVIVVSATVADQAPMREADAVLSKPFDISELLGTIYRVSRDHQAHARAVLH